MCVRLKEKLLIYNKKERKIMKTRKLLLPLLAICPMMIAAKTTSTSHKTKIITTREPYYNRTQVVLTNKTFIEEDEFGLKYSATVTSQDVQRVLFIKDKQINYTCSYKTSKTYDTVIKNGPFVNQGITPQKSVNVEFHVAEELKDVNEEGAVYQYTWFLNYYNFDVTADNTITNPQIIEDSTPNNYLLSFGGEILTANYTMILGISYDGEYYSVLVEKDKKIPVSEELDLSKLEVRSCKVYETVDHIVEKEVNDNGGKSGLGKAIGAYIKAALILVFLLFFIPVSIIVPTILLSVYLKKRKARINRNLNGDDF